MHRDSVGSEQAIRPGEVNWMTAGRGITHSERFERARREGDRMHGIQAWVALPEARRGDASRPSRTTAPATCPSYEEGGAVGAPDRRRGVRREGQVETRSPMFYLHWDLAAGARAGLPAEYAERAALRRERRGRVRRPARSRRARWLILDAGQDGGRRGAAALHRPRARRRAARPALHRVELRLVLEGAHRAGEGRLARRADEAARPRQSGIHPAALVVPAVAVAMVVIVVVVAAVVAFTGLRFRRARQPLAARPVGVVARRAGALLLDAPLIPVAHAVREDRLQARELRGAEHHRRVVRRN